KWLLENYASRTGSSEDGCLEGALSVASTAAPHFVKRQLANRSDASSECDWRQLSLLPWASHYGYAAVVKLLLDEGANANWEDPGDKNGWTALHRAAMNGNEIVVRLLLKKGASVDTISKDRTTALYWATVNGHEGVVKLLLQR